MTNFLKIIFYTLFLPFFLAKDAIESKRSIFKKVFYFLFVLVTFGLIWLQAAKEVKLLVSYSLFELGILDKIQKVQVSGTSMMPAIFDGSEISLNNPRKFGLERGDIVSFNNEETGGLSYLKRIIALPGEKIAIKNGHVSVNDQILKETYTLNDLPTFGNTAVLDCESYTVPSDSYFVLGDNRTVSSDSRVIGFVKEKDIEGVMKTKLKTEFLNFDQRQGILKKNVDQLELLSSMNQLRRQKQVAPLSLNEQLSQMARERAQVISNNLSDWKRKVEDLESVLERNGYITNLVHEYVTFGYLDAQGILDQILDLHKEKEAFLSESYTEVGVGVTEITKGECTFPVISILLSWPLMPPTNLLVNP